MLEFSSICWSSCIATCTCPRSIRALETLKLRWRNIFLPILSNPAQWHNVCLRNCRLQVRYLSGSFFLIYFPRIRFQSLQKNQTTETNETVLANFLQKNIFKIASKFPALRELKKVCKTSFEVKRGRGEHHCPARPPGP